MLGFDKEFRDGTSKINKAWINLTLSDGTSLEYHEDRVMMNGIVRDSSTTVDGQFTVGAAVTGKMTVILGNSDDALSVYDFRGATMVVWLGGVLSDNTEEKVNVGRYYVDEYSYDGNNVTLVGYDDMTIFDIPCNGNMIWPSTSSNRTLYAIAARACSVASSVSGSNISLHPSNNLTFFSSRCYSSITGSSAFRLSETQPPQWDTMTLHDLVAAIAQVVCLYAHIVYEPSPGAYYLKFDWYDTGSLTSNQYDGGTFGTSTTPYSDGARLDGGTFSTTSTPYSDGDTADGGDWSNGDDRSALHIIPSPYDMSVDTDDVLITGTSVSLEPSDNIEADGATETYTKTCGTAGYVIQISGNPLILTTENADKVANILLYYMNGMRFRPLSASVVENPSLEAGDVALIQGKNGNTYACFLSHVTYTVNAATEISCDAESTMQNLKSRYSGAQKTQAMVKKAISTAVASNAETAMVGILTSYATSRGLYQYTETDSSGGTIYTYGNASTLASSDIRWRISAGSIMVSTDYGAHWNSALSADGTAVMQSLYAVGINADYIDTGTLTVGGNGRGVGTIYIKNASNTIIGIIDSNGVYYGKTGVNDTTNSGFFLAKDGFIVGDATDNLYFQALSNGEITIHDNPAAGEGALGTTFKIESSYGTTTLGSAYSGFSGEVDFGDNINVAGSIYVDGDIRADGAIYDGGGKLIRSSSQNGLVYDLVAVTTTSPHYLQVKTIINDSYINYGINMWTSDEKLKKNIKDSNVDALSVVNTIRHRSFEWKDTGNKNQNGYIAQELEKAIPGSTFDVSQPDGSETKQVDEAAIIPYLSKAIQELSAKIDALEARVAELEGGK